MKMEMHNKVLLGTNLCCASDLFQSVALSNKERMGILDQMKASNVSSDSLLLGSIRSEH